MPPDEEDEEIDRLRGRRLIDELERSGVRNVRLELSTKQIKAVLGALGALGMIVYGRIDALHHETRPVIGNPAAAESINSSLERIKGAVKAAIKDARKDGVPDAAGR